MPDVTLGYKDGWLCAVERDPEPQTPVVTITYWPFFRDSRAVWEADLGKELRKEEQPL